MWSYAMSLGIPNELFWSLSLREVQEVFARHDEAERKEYLRAGLIAATVVNVHRRKGARLVQPGDFIRRARKPEDYMSVAEATKAMNNWAARQNHGVADKWGARDIP